MDSALSKVNGRLLASHIAHPNWWLAGAIVGAIAFVWWSYVVAIPWIGTKLGYSMKAPFAAGQNLPQWHLGNADAGNGGSMDRGYTVHNATPGGKGSIPSLGSIAMPNTSVDGKPPSCPKGTVARKSADGASIYCEHPGALPSAAAAAEARTGWSADALAEAEQLAALGALQPSSSPGEAALRRAVNLEDSQLAAAMAGYHTSDVAPSA